MKKYGPSLKVMLRRSKFKRFSIKTAIQVGIQMLSRLENLHSLGYLHCDLKPDNILLGNANRNRPESSKIILIDFGISKCWQDTYGGHIKQQKGVPFSGNLLFASQNAFKQMSQSRRDDLISLAYLLSFLVVGDITWLSNFKPQDPNFFTKIMRIKMNMKPDQLCSGQARGLLPYVEEVFAYSFDEAPNYAKLKHYLARFLMAHDVFPDNNFDWSIMPRKRKPVMNMEVDQECDEKIVAAEIEESKIDLAEMCPKMKKQLSEQIDLDIS